MAERLELQCFKPIYRSQCVNCGALGINIKCKKHMFARINYKHSLVDFDVCKVGQGDTASFINIIVKYNFKINCDAGSDCRKAKCVRCDEVFRHNSVRQFQQVVSIYESWIQTWITMGLQSLMIAHEADDASDRLIEAVNNNPAIANNGNFILAALNIDNPEI